MDHERRREPAAGKGGGVPKLHPTTVNQQEVRTGSLVGATKRTGGEVRIHGLLPDQQNGCGQKHPKTTEVPTASVLRHESDELADGDGSGIDHLPVDPRGRAHLHHANLGGLRVPGELRSCDDARRRIV